MEIIKGKRKKPFNVLMLGTPGIGKTSWAASCPEPIFITAEEIDEIDSARLPQLKTFDEIFEQINFIKKNGTEYKTVVVDTVDALEKLLHVKVLAEDPKGRGSMAKAHGGYGKAYEMALMQMYRVREELKDLRDNHGKNIVMLCHTKTKKTADTVLGVEYDEYKLSLHDKVEGLLVDWVSAVLFANYVTHMKDSDNNKNFALGDGERVILTEKRPGHLAKNRYELPYELPMPIENPCGPFMEYYEAFYKGNVRSEEQIRSSIESLMEMIEDENLKPKVVAAYKDAGNEIKKLNLVEKTLKERLGQQ